MNFVGSGSGSIAFKESIPGVTTGPSSQGLLGFHAAGGQITGGTPGRDSVLGMLMPGEVVVPTKMVKAGAVDHLRGMLPGFANGGSVSSTGLGAFSSMMSTGQPFMQHTEAAFGKAVEAAFAKAAIAKFEKDAAAAGGSGGSIVKFAESFLGKIPYVWGGTSLSRAGADCSGFTQAVYGHFGIHAPRTSEAQGAWVRRTGPQPGGLAFYHSPPGGPDPGHVAIVADALTAISQGGGMGPVLMGLHDMPLLWTGIPPGGFPGGAAGGATPGGVMSATQIEALWDQMGGRPTAAGNMARIAYAESGDNPGAVQAGQPFGLTGMGLYQITPTSGISQNGAFGNLLNASTNTRAAISLYNSSGYLPWASDPVASALIANGISYAGGGLIGGGGGGQRSTPQGFASGGVAGQGAALLKAWQTRRGGGFGAAWGPVVVNRQIDAMTSALHTATTLAGAKLPSAQHKKYAALEALDKRKLTALTHERDTERSWRGMLGSSDATLASWIKAAGNTKSLQPSVKKWKSQMAGQEKTIAGISKMLGFSAAQQAAINAATALAAKTTGVNLPAAAHTYGGDVGVVVNDIGAFLASNAVGPLGKARGGLVRSFDSGGVLSPGMNLAWNGTGKNEPLVPAGGGQVCVTMEIAPGGGTAFDQFMVAWMKKHTKIKGGGSVQHAFGSH